MKKRPSSRPYLVRGMYQWLVDCDEVPQILCDATIEGCDVPVEHVKDGRIVFNISQVAVRDLDLADDYIAFNASFSQTVRDIYIPMVAVMAIFARDSNDGMFFGDDDPGGPPSLVAAQQARSKTPHLRIVKSDRDD